MLTGMVDGIFSDVSQPDKARIIHINALNYLRNGGGFVFSIKLIVYIQLLNLQLYLQIKFKNKENMDLR